MPSEQRTVHGENIMGAIDEKFPPVNANLSDGMSTPMARNEILLQHRSSNKPTTDSRLQSPLIIGDLSRSGRKYRSPNARGGSLDQGSQSPTTNDPVKQMIRRLRLEKRER